MYLVVALCAQWWLGALPYVPVVAPTPYPTGGSTPPYVRVVLAPPDLMVTPFEPI